MTWSHVELDIDCAAIGHNVALIRRSIGPERRLCAIVKADAYGLGAEVLGPRIERAGADMLAVFSLDEVSVLLEAEVRIPILVLMPVWDVPRHHAIHLALAEQRLHLTVHDAGHLDRLESMVGGDGVGPPVRLPVHLEVDTGMSRGGCGLESAEPLIRRVAASPSVRLAGIMTHFAKAETDADCTDGQLGRFEALLDRVRSILPDDCLVHAANTHAMLRSDRYQLGMVRIGLAWAGYGGAMGYGIAILLAIAATLAVRAQLHERVGQNLHLLFAAFVIIVITASQSLLPTIDTNIKSSKAIAQAVRDAASSTSGGGPVYWLGFHEPSVLFYLDQPVDDPVRGFASDQAIADWARNGEPGVFIVTRQQLDRLNRQFGKLPMEVRFTAEPINYASGGQRQAVLVVVPATPGKAGG